MTTAVEIKKSFFQMTGERYMVDENDWDLNVK